MTETDEMLQPGVGRANTQVQTHPQRSSNCLRGPWDVAYSLRRVVLDDGLLRLRVVCQPSNATMALSLQYFDGQISQA